MESSPQGINNSRQKTRRGKPRRPPADPGPGTGGPIRPRARKPPPSPSGDFCIHKLCCHFGLKCVNAHTQPEIAFFRRRAELRLELREMQLEVEKEKIEFQRTQVTARKPLQNTTNVQQPSADKGAAASKPGRSQLALAKTKSASEKPATSTTKVSQHGQVQHTSRPRTPPRPPPSTPQPKVVANATVAGSISPLDAHARCIEKETKCTDSCVLRDATDHERWSGKFIAQLPVWGRPMDPWGSMEPKPEHRYVLEPGGRINVDFAAACGSVGTQVGETWTNTSWLHDASTFLWFPLTTPTGEPIFKWESPNFETEAEMRATEEKRWDAGTHYW